ncbi:tetratricopeptide repeat protein [Mongoliitalea lutea]|uniref:Surface lipoprotein assembly modifier N-terminal TPR repeats region domain-containing protein n=1 Tax=Mongoliitalea lutea TaxID=849756 RepID=A0A8J3CYU7_9BACT|nr:tetratricopeptide repeat protein [Mongoliitalea lutea]GHB46260.1 hypothetical protein GCM10008106_29010 [Mongoliitalea lutea]
MKKSQIIAIVIGVVAIGLLFSLPRVIVKNDDGESAISEAGSSSPSGMEDLHNAPIAPEAQEALQRISEKLNKENDLERFAALTDTLASLYSQAGKFDSAAYFLDKAADRIQSLERFEKAGIAYYEAYTFALNEEKVAYLADRTRFFLNKVLDENPTRSDLKTRVAMTYVSSSNPMQGITMLREILDADPTNEDALFNMGILSMQSGQHRRAVERFEELVKHHPANIQGQFYLAVSYFESKQNNKAKKQFQEVRNMSTDPMILASVDSYLERL